MEKDELEPVVMGVMQDGKPMRVLPSGEVVEYVPGFIGRSDYSTPNPASR